MVKEQECKYCLKVKSAEMFNVAPRNLNGLNRKCKQCMADTHRAKHPVEPPPVDLEGEEWRQVDGYDGDYEVSSFGRIKSYKKGLHKLLKIHFNIKGYPVVHITKLHTQPKSRSIHRLVGLTFIPNPENLPQINHKDGVKTNNNVSNLEWCDNTYNQRHAWENGLGNPSRGSTNGMSKLTNEIVLRIRREYPDKSQNELSREYGVSQSQIWSIVNRKTWFHI